MGGGQHAHAVPPQQRSQPPSWPAGPDAPPPAWARGPCLGAASRARASPAPAFLLPQVYFFCSASACSPSGLEPCSAPCGSRTARESVFLHPSVLASGPLGPGHQPDLPSSPAGQRRAAPGFGDTAEPQDVASSPGPVGFVDSYRQEPAPGPAGTGLWAAPRPWPPGLLAKRDAPWEGQEMFTPWGQREGPAAAAAAGGHQAWREGRHPDSLALHRLRRELGPEASPRGGAAAGGCGPGPGGWGLRGPEPGPGPGAPGGRQGLNAQ